jgi:hypothetical protein
MVVERTPLSALAERSTASLAPGRFDDVLAHYSLPAFDDGATPHVVGAEAARSGKFHLTRPCVLFAKLNPRIPRIWNVVGLPAEMAVASAEFVVLRPVAAGTSGSHQRIRPDDLLGTAVRDVRRLAPAAARTVTGLGALCHARRAERVRLAALRDALLPLLMSGEIRVRDAGAGDRL